MTSHHTESSRCHNLVTKPPPEQISEVWGEPPPPPPLQSDPLQPPLFCELNFTPSVACLSSVVHSAVHTKQGYSRGKKLKLYFHMHVHNSSSPQSLLVLSSFGHTNSSHGCMGVVWVWQYRVKESIDQSVLSCEEESTSSASIIVAPL